MALEDKRFIYPAIAIIDTIVDFVFIADFISIFFIPIANTEGKYKL
jgi:hypothetical protein